MGELQSGLHLVALAHTFFFVGGDAFGPLGGNVFDAVEVFDLFSAIQRGPAGDAAVCIALGAKVAIASAGAQTRHFGGQFSAYGHLVLAANREQGFDNPVLAAFVVNQAIGAKLAQRQETRAR